MIKGKVDMQVLTEQYVNSSIIHAAARVHNQIGLLRLFFKASEARCIHVHVLQRDWENDLKSFQILRFPAEAK